MKDYEIFKKLLEKVKLKIMKPKDDFVKENYYFIVYGNEVEERKRLLNELEQLEQKEIKLLKKIEMLDIIFKTYLGD